MLDTEEQKQGVPNAQQGGERHSPLLREEAASTNKALSLNELKK